MILNTQTPDLLKYNEEPNGGTVKKVNSETMIDNNNPTGLLGRARFRKRVLTPTKARSESPKKAK